MTSLTAQALDDELRRAEATDAQSIVVDLSGLHFIDSTGLRLLLAANTGSCADRHRLTLLRGSQHIARAFEITGLDKILP